jgi:hypothetical protein
MKLPNTDTIWRATVLALLAPAPCSAQMIYQSRITGQPLQYMTDGKVNGCGLRMIAVRSLSDDTFESVDASVNLYATTAVFKAAATVVSADAKKTNVKRVVEAWVKGAGSQATSVVGKAVEGADRLSRLYVTPFASAMGVFKSQVDGKPVQIGLKHEGSRGMTTIFAGKIELTEAERDQMEMCLDDLIKGAQETLKEKK